MTALHVAPPQALPSPRSEEWWFSAWEIQDKLWPLTQGRGVIVGLIDAGVEAKLPDLDGTILKGMKFAAPSGGDARTDDDGAKGGHGTAMAALIVGQGRGTGMVGIAPESRILPISASGADFAISINYAADHGAKVINISAGGNAVSCPADVQRAVYHAIERDVVIVASAGNEGGWADSDIYPANCPGVLAVGGVDANLQVWEKSTPGDNVMVAAPSVSVGSIGKNGKFGWDNNGTSQAAALTSGVVALMRSRYPQMSGRQVVQRLLATAKDVGPKRWDKKTGYGAIIPYLALTVDVPVNAPNPVYAAFDQVNSRALKTDATRDQRNESGRVGTRVESKPKQWIWISLLFASGIACVGILASALIFRKRG